MWTRDGPQALVVELGG